MFGLQTLRVRSTVAVLTDAGLCKEAIPVKAVAVTYFCQYFLDLN